VLAVATTTALSGSRVSTGLIVAACFLVARLTSQPVRRHLVQLPLMRHLTAGLGAVVALAVLEVTATATPAAAIALLAAVLVGTALIDAPLRRVRASDRRIAIVGPDPTALALRRELRESGTRGFEVVGRISIGPADPPGHVASLGTLAEMRAIVVAHDIDLLVLAHDIPRLPVFDRLASSCLELPVALVDLDHFCERVFGRVPVAAINPSWFQYLMHPSFRRAPSPGKRAIDVVVAAAAGLVFLPAVMVAALLIRRDGGPAFFRQTRIGEGGRAFEILKLRTMTVARGPMRWTAPDDPRVTRIGRVLRRTHLDEVPQVLNVLRGEMSLVGPRPEQPEYVAELEQSIPFYSRRHLIKPGVTGWAQVRCGYAGSVEGSAWKMCHDLYYLKHRGVALDLLILGETLRTLLADRQFPGAPPQPPVLDQPVAAAPERALVAS
jgi:exopolysaccharide biosynthesis polyprenyl glycosylphosphotransferase